MEVIWTESAKMDLISYQIHSKKINYKSYIISLVKFVDNLYISPQLGKVLFVSNQFEVRQLIYKMHKVLYTIKNNHILILVVSHNHRNINSIIKYLKIN